MEVLSVSRNAKSYKRRFTLTWGGKIKCINKIEQNETEADFKNKSSTSIEADTPCKEWKIVADNKNNQETVYSNHTVFEKLIHYWTSTYYVIQYVHHVFLQYFWPLKCVSGAHLYFFFAIAK